MTLFIIQPFASHYYPTFSLAKDLINKGEYILYTTTPFINKNLVSEGFAFHEFEYLSEYMINSNRSFLGFLLKSLLSKEFYKIRLKEFENAYRLTLDLLEKYQPTQVYLDQSLAEYYYFLKPHVENITILHTKFYSGRLKGVPPMNSTYIPKNNRYSSLVCDLLWFKLLAKQRWNEFLLKVAFLGKDEAYFWKLHCKKYGLDWTNKTDFKHALNKGIKNIDTVILAPENLEFSTFKPSKFLKFYNHLSTKNETKYYLKKYINFKNENLGPNHKPIIYLAFGTLASANYKTEQFFNDVLSIVAEIKDAFILISLGNTSMNLIPTKNSIIFDFVPQLDVLSFSNLFITHGGLGSVKKAYHAKVPMLVVPINKKIDQPGNAARVKANGLGDYLNIDNYTTKELKHKIENLLNQKEVKVSKTYSKNEQLV